MMFCEECKQEFGSTSLYAAHLCTPTEDRQRIAELEAQLAAAKQQADSGLDSLIDAMGDEGLELDLAIIPRACAVIRSLRAHRDDLKGELENVRAAADEMYAVYAHAE